MVPIGPGEDSRDLLTLVVCGESNDSDLYARPTDFHEISVSTADISSWDLPSLLAHRILKIEVDANRLIEESSYFRGILSGSFSEPRENSLAIHWDAESFLAVLMVIFGCHVEITSDNFIALNEVALFFGVDLLILKCQVWLEEVTSSSGVQSPQLCLDELINIWKYGIEHAHELISHHCTSFLARKFMWASALGSFKGVPEKLFCSCIQHPDLTVDSEKHFCDVLLVWLATNAAKLDGRSSNDLCQKVRTNLLPLWFAAGKQSCPLFSTFSIKATKAILHLARIPGTSLIGFFREHDLKRLRLRLTKYSQKVDVSCCPQITAGLFLISLLPSLGEALMVQEIIKNCFAIHANSFGDKFLVPEAVNYVLSFEAVHELDISNCPSLSLESIIDFLSKSFPSLRTLKAAYFFDLQTEILCHLVQRFPLLENVDLTLDMNPVIPGQVSIIAASSGTTQQRSKSSSHVYNYHSVASLTCTPRPSPSNIKKLSLAGRMDVDDSNLCMISDICPSLNYVDIRGCICVTDNGISIMILKCKMLHSVLVCGTSFGTNSIMALLGVSSETKQIQSTTYQLQALHVGGCHGVNGKALSMLMGGSNHLMSLCLREIQHVDDALYKFSGTSLEILDVSDTKVSGGALSHVIHRNPCLKSLKTKGCPHLLQHDDAEERKLHNSSDLPKEWYSELGSSCKLEEVELGWGISFFSFQALKPALRTLRTLVVGLGGSLGNDDLKLLPSVCKMLETLILYFQEISDSALTSIMKTLPQLQCLALCYCFGDISSLSFRFRMPALRILKLERVTPWMTNKELATLSANCVNLVELSLIGCTLLNSGALSIISSGWPGLKTLRLEDCGKITMDGVESLSECHALEDLTLRHTGSGIPRGFIIDSAAKLPMLRKISLDVCDAKAGDFNLPDIHNRCFLTVVKIAKCKIHKSFHHTNKLESGRTPVHKETLVLTWNDTADVTTVVRERL